MLNLRAAKKAVRLGYSVTLSVVAFLTLWDPGAASAQDPAAHPDSSTMPMRHDWTMGNDAMATRQGMANMETMPGMTMLPRPLGIPMSRMGSGTSWLPDASPMRAYHFTPHGWMLMVHGDVDLLQPPGDSTRG